MGAWHTFLIPPQPSVDSNLKRILFQVKVLLPEGGGDSPGRRRDFRCPICPKAFTKSASLDRHAALHRGEKRHACDECGARFSHALSLGRHRRKAHFVDPEGKCTRCPKCGAVVPVGVRVSGAPLRAPPGQEPTGNDDDDYDEIMIMIMMVVVMMSSR